MKKSSLLLVQVKRLPIINIRSKCTYLLTEKDGDKKPFTLWIFRDGKWNDIEEDVEENTPQIVQVEALPKGAEIDQDKIYLLTMKGGEIQAYTLWMYVNKLWQQIAPPSAPVASYKVYTALLTQIDTEAPTAVVLENTIGNITFTRYAPGGYKAVLLGSFPEAKAWAIIKSSNIAYSVAIERADNDSFNIYTQHLNNNADLLLKNTPIEIRVYN
jgi:hypothetical protein